MDIKFTQFKDRHHKAEAKVEVRNRPATFTNAPKVKTTSFDGTIPFQCYKLQFEQTATANNWSMAKKIAALFVALKGPAADILQPVPEGEGDNYDALMVAVGRRYGSEQIYQVELENQYQNELCRNSLPILRGWLI